MANPRPLLSIVGPTATGKTDFALQLDEVLPDQKLKTIDVISADSRQVYKDFEVVSGADIPGDFLWEGEYGADDLSHHFYRSDEYKLHGISILDLEQDWSVAHFRKFAQEVMEYSYKHDGLPVLVGGTGLYHQQVLSDDLKIEIGPQDQVRYAAATMSVTELQDWLKGIDPEKFAVMNRSDQMNPRRLVRAIEISHGLAILKEPTVTIIQPVNQLTIGLTDSIENITKRIIARVDERMHGQKAMIEVEVAIDKLREKGLEKEIKSLPAFSATGVKEIMAFLDGKIDEVQLRELWIRREVQYAKRQLTWWKKQKDIQWFNVSEPEWQQAALDVIANWLHHQVYEET
jgi:tRNA dimethylallyltransferase